MEKLFIFSWSAASLAIALFLFFLSPAASQPFYKPVEITPRTGFREIAESLADNGIIRSRRTFLIYGLISGSAHQLKPGNYLLSAGSSTPAIILALIEGPKIDKEITIPEGATLKDIDEMLSQKGIFPKESLDKFMSLRDISRREKSKSIVDQYEFLRGVSSLEGFLFPDTYRFFLNSNTETVARKFLDNFAKKAMPFLTNNKQSRRLQVGTPTDNVGANNLITIASLLEKEAPNYKDRQIIAGIIYKRIQLGMALQIDATITYAKCAGKFLTCADPKVYRKDLEFQSPYNTYLHNELPPGPIGNPGSEAIKAALNPAKSDYLYYLSDPKTKKIIFSKTLEEHIDNRAIYLKS